ncbi:MAG TPA: carbamoyltransferase HypF [Euzebyales bacterium]
MRPTADDRLRVRVRITGNVQGVGFRQYVHRLAGQLGLGGFVGNDAQGVVTEVEGASPAVRGFLTRLPAEAPGAAVIDQVTSAPVDVRGDDAFTVVVSDAPGPRHVPVSPDIAPCADCLAELFDPDDRRFRHPFINCANCGPRYSIVRDVPYDRTNTTMAGFAMCDACAREYADPTGRRFLAQPLCCPACGPQLSLVDGAGARLVGEPGPRHGGPRSHDDAALARSAALLRAGRILAVKGLGGFHLAVDATDEAAVARLRTHTGHQARPFAVMVADLDAALALCEADVHERARLTWSTAPIVVLRRRDACRDGVAAPTADEGSTSAATIVSSVGPGSRDLGVMLPYTPLHHLLVAGVGRPIALTGGAVSDAPVGVDDADAIERLGGIADAFLTHDRPVHIRVDDSVVRMMGDRPLLVRRSRGYAPQPVLLGRPVPRPVLAVGAELESTVCLASQRRAYLSHPLGDLGSDGTYRSLAGVIDHLSRLFDITPSVVAHDLHPGYLSTRYARDLDGVDRVGVQHHHAHVASCMADNGVSDPVIGVVLDGPGHGTDGTMWGGEILVADLGTFERAGHLQAVGLPGGVAATPEPWRMAASWLHRAYGDDVPELAVGTRIADRWASALAAARAGADPPSTSSAARLFDAVAALVGVRDAVTYEGQTVVELEQAAAPAVRDGYRAALTGGEPFTIDGATLIRAVVDDLRVGTPVPVIAARFHAWMVAAIVAACGRVRDTTGLSMVALSGSLFTNVLLVERAVSALDDAGFTVLTHGRVPPNDGGISFGQTAVAAARDRAPAT